jgi:hypothetical protein
MRPALKTGTIPAQSTTYDAVTSLCVHTKILVFLVFRVWAGSESNTRHKDFQSFALPTELPAHRDSRIGAAGDSSSSERSFVSSRPVPCNRTKKLRQFYGLRFWKHVTLLNPRILQAPYLNSLAQRDSTKSITRLSRFASSSRSISCTPVGLVTFTSVR